MKKGIAVILLLMLCLNMFCMSVSAEKLELESRTAVLMDAESGQILYAKNPNDKVYPASVTKVLTVYLAATQLEKSEQIAASHAAVDAVPRDSTNISLDYGEVLTMEQAAYATMLMSANDAANLLGEQISGSLSAFSDLMNTTAQSFGATATHFENANGLPDDNHYTTARDFAVITKEAIKSKAFMEYFGGVEYSIPATNKNDEARNFVSKHRMMHMDKYEDLGVKGGKTGYTKKANHTMVTYAEKDGKKLIVTVFDAPTLSGTLKDTQALLNMGYKDFKQITVTAADMGEKSENGFLYKPQGDIRAYVTQDSDKSELTYNFVTAEKKVLVSDKQGNLLATVPLTATEIPKEVHVWGILANIFAVILGVVILFLLWRRHNINKSKKKRRKAKRDAIMNIK